MTATDTAVRVAELRDAYRREQAAKNRQLQSENRRLRADKEYAEKILLAILQCSGTVVVPKNVRAKGELVVERNTAGDIIVRLEDEK